MASDLGAKVVRLFAAWPGVVIRDGRATYELLRAPSLPYEAQYPFLTRLDRWNFVKGCLKEAAAFGEEFGVVMALQNHPPFIRHWKDIYDLVREVNSPWLKVCLDLPMLTQFDKEFVQASGDDRGQASDVLALRRGVRSRRRRPRAAPLRSTSRSRSPTMAISSA